MSFSLDSMYACWREECLLLSSYPQKRSVIQIRLITIVTEDDKRIWNQELAVFVADRWRYVFQHTIFWNMSNQTIKTTAYQIYIYLNFENKNEIHKPEAKHLNSEQESINKNIKSCYQFFFTAYYVFACCQHCWVLRKSP